MQQLKSYTIHRCSGVQAMADTLNKQLSRMPDSPEELYELKLVIMERQNYALDAQVGVRACAAGWPTQAALRVATA